MSLFRKAAEKGHAGALYSIGVMYNEGRGVPQNYAEAIKYYRKAIEKGDVGARYNLAVMYFNGEGESQNYVKAYANLQVAAQLEDESACNSLTIVTLKMSPEQIAEGQRLAETILNQLPR